MWLPGGISIPRCAISHAVRFHEAPKLAFVAATLTAGLNDIAWHLFSPIRPVCPPPHTPMVDGSGLESAIPNQ